MNDSLAIQDGSKKLEVGNSVFELIQFSISRQLRDGTVMTGIYGVNVAKVREVLRLPKINPLASRVREIAGVFHSRGTPIPVVNLAAALGDEKSEILSSDQVIVAEFSQKRAGFIVTSTQRIRRISWEKVLPPSSDSESCITGMTLIENDEFLFIIDFEKILLDLDVKAGYSPTVFTNTSSMARYNDSQVSMQKPSYPVCNVGDKTTILLVDDSAIIVSTVKSFLQSQGFFVIEARNGKQALELVKEYTQSPDKKIDCIVTDVEMPQLDGLTLTRIIREELGLKELPIILHTSLSGKANQQAGLTVGANGYVVKNNVRSLMELIVELIGNPGKAA